MGTTQRKTDWFFFTVHPKRRSCSWHLLVSGVLFLSTSDELPGFMIVTLGFYFLNPVAAAMPHGTSTVKLLSFQLETATAEGTQKLLLLVVYCYYYCRLLCWALLHAHGIGEPT